MSSDLYMKHAIGEVEKKLSDQQLRLPSKVSTPLSVGYRSEVDGTKLLGPRQASYFQGINWNPMIRRIDILHNVAVRSRFLATPREGHLEQCLHIFAYLKKYSHSKIVFDDHVPVFDKEQFQQCNWEEFHPGAEEVLPPNVPEAWGKPLTMTCFVDADHASCHVNTISILNCQILPWNLSIHRSCTKTYAKF